ncbi:MAG: BolA/IbaG family iron-sulfur metabolism protein [Arsenophonus sp.]|nr:MAG: BolA/IbaG family iron-sulfur metabolism protein [Arsenophonus sp.]
MAIDKFQNEIKQLLLKTLKLDEVIIKSNGNYFQVIVVGEMFYGMTAVQKQQIIYKPLTKYITNNKIHALSIKVYTPIEWSKICECK